MGPRSPHEFFLWKDAKRPGRALVYLAIHAVLPGPRSPRHHRSARADGGGRLRPRHRHRRENTAAVLDERQRLPALARGDRRRHPRLHGHLGLRLLRRRHLDAGRPDRRRRARHRPTGRRRQAATTAATCTARSRVPGRPLAVVVEEAYANAGTGCPFGWLRMADVTDEAAPKLLGEFTIQENDCERAKELNGTFTSHNQTVFPERRADGLVRRRPARGRHQRPGAPDRGRRVRAEADLRAGPPRHPAVLPGQQQQPVDRRDVVLPGRPGRTGLRRDIDLGLLHPRVHRQVREGGRSRPGTSRATRARRASPARTR